MQHCECSINLALFLTISVLYYESCKGKIVYFDPPPGEKPLYYLTSPQKAQTSACPLSFEADLNLLSIRKSTDTLFLSFIGTKCCPTFCNWNLVNHK